LDREVSIAAKSFFTFGSLYSFSPFRISIFAHSLQRLIPVAASTSEERLAPPTRADVSKK